MDLLIKALDLEMPELAILQVLFNLYSCYNVSIGEYGKKFQWEKIQFAVAFFLACEAG